MSLRSFVASCLKPLLVAVLRELLVVKQPLRDCLVSNHRQIIIIFQSLWFRMFSKRYWHFLSHYFFITLNCDPIPVMCCPQLRLFWNIVHFKSENIQYIFHFCKFFVSWYWYWFPSIRAVQCPHIGVWSIDLCQLSPFQNSIAFCGAFKLHRMVIGSASAHSRRHRTSGTDSSLEPGSWRAFGSRMKTADWFPTRMLASSLNKDSVHIGKDDHSSESQKQVSF